MINVKQWMDLPLEVRAKIIKDFNLVKTGKAGIANNKIVSDGYTQNDILKVSLQNLQSLMDSSEENFDVLFDEYKKLIKNSFKVIDEYKHLEGITVDVSFIEEPTTKPLVTEEEFNPNMAPSGDTETYFGTKIKPVTYKPNDKKTDKRK